MRCFNVVLGSLIFMTNLAFATPTNPINGEEYLTLKSPQPVLATAKKIEVIEFFMYHCPACNMLDPALTAWVNKQGNNIIFKRIHIARRGSKDVEARLFLTLDAMHKEDELHNEVLNTWHVKRIPLRNDEENIAWAVKNGIDKEKFLETYNSFAVLSKLGDLSRIAANYQIDSTPTIIVDGRYQTSLALVSESNTTIPTDKLADATLQVLDALVEKARAEKTLVKP